MRPAQTRSTYALLIAGVLSTLVLVSMPVFVGAIASTFGWGDREVGWLASADMAGSCLASLCVIPFINRLPWRALACVAIAVTICGNLLSTQAGSLESLLAMRVLAGFGNGLMLSIAYVGLCRSGNPDRFFGLYTFSQLSLQILTLSTFPLLLAAYGLNALFVLLAGVAAGCLALVMLFPRSMPPATAFAALDHPRGGRIAIPAAIAIGAQALYFLAPGAAWGYFERIGVAFDLSLGQIGNALGVASFIGIAGALLVVLLGQRVGRWPSMVFGTALSIMAMVILMEGSGIARYLAAAALFNFAWNYTFPYQMGVLAALDRNGAVAILSLIVQLAGLAAGPLLASLLRPEQGYDAILLACVGCYIVSLLLFRVSSRNHA